MNQGAPVTNQHPRPAASAVPRRTGSGAFTTKRQAPDEPQHRGGVIRAWDGAYVRLNQRRSGGS